MNDELDLLDGSFEPVYNQGKRPAFLTVVCILTFVGVGISIFYGVFELYSISQMAGFMNDMPMGIGGDDTFYSGFKWMKINVYLGFVGASLCLAGALIMWKLKKAGYFIYIGGQAIPLIGSFFSLGSTIGGIFAGFSIFVMILYLIFPVGFIVMYGLNYKYLK